MNLLPTTVTKIANEIVNLRYEEDKLCWDYKGETFNVRASEVPPVLVPQDPATKTYLANRYGFLLQ
jgi:hypothetical protein